MSSSDNFSSVLARIVKDTPKLNVVEGIIDKALEMMPDWIKAQKEAQTDQNK